MSPRERNIAAVSALIGAALGGLIAYVFVIVRVYLNVCAIFPDQCH